MWVQKGRTRKNRVLRKTHFKFKNGVTMEGGGTFTVRGRHVKVVCS